ncbi:MAG: hypothetical protein VXW32_03835 [Myxococcota bacterium]|nr:hypothetical protein [Myxococcota bacterium]
MKFIVTRQSLVGLSSLVVLACTSAGGGGGSKDSTSDSGAGSDTGEEVVDTWRAKGSGYAYLLDGTEDHSLFRLEIEGTLIPREGHSYYGWLMGGSDGYKLMGPIPVNVSEVEFEVDIGVNGLRNGYREFQVFQHDSEPLNPGVGDPVWAGAMPEDSLEIVRGLLGGGTATNEGSLREMETTAERIIAAAQDAIDGFSTLPEFNAKAEAISNAIAGEAEDVDQNGQVETLEGSELGLIGDTSHVSQTLADLTEAFEAFGGLTAEDHIRDALDDAYDCIQRVDAYADKAQTYAGIATVCAGQGSCQSTMETVVEQLDLALNGEDLNEDGVISAEQNEGTIECGIEYISRLVGFSVELAN